MTALCFLACCTEGRIKVYEGDMIAITRWQGKWVYGNKILLEGQYKVGWGLQIYVTLGASEKCWNLSIRTLLRLVNIAHLRSVFLHITEAGADSDLEECRIKVSNSVFLHITDTGDGCCNTYLYPEGVLTSKRQKNTTETRRDPI